MNLLMTGLDTMRSNTVSSTAVKDCPASIWRRTVSGTCRFIAMAAVGALLVGVAHEASAQTAPPYVVYSQVPLSGANSVNPSASFGGFRGHPAFNSRGDLFMSDGGGQHLYEYPANGGPAFLVFTDTNANQFSGATVDPFDNLFYGVFSYGGYSNGNDQNSLQYEFPSTNGSYQGLPYVFNQNSPPGSCLPAAPAMGSTPAVVANTTVCSVGFYVGAINYYWQGPFDTAVDSNTNVYAITGDNNTTGNSGDLITQCVKACAQQIPGNGVSVYTVKLANAVQSIAVTYAGDLYTADNTNVSIIPAKSPSTKNTPVVFDSTYNQPYGVSFDPSGNLYVTDVTGVWEVPAVETGGAACKGGADSCTLTASSKFLLIPMQTSTAGLYNSYLAPAIDNRGHIVVSPYYGYVVEDSLWSGSFPSSSIGTIARFGPAATGVNTLNFTVSFNTATTIAGFTAVQGSGPSTEFAVSPGSCTTGTAFAANSTCTFTATFTPSGLGVRTGSVVITDSTGKSTYTNLTGTGTGTGLTVDPGTPTQIGSGYKKAAGLAVDVTGNVYIADSAANKVQEYPVGGGAAVSIGTGLNVPTGVATDAAGSVYIVNQGTGKTGGTVVEVPIVAGVLTNSAQKTLVSGLNLPTDIIVDGNGNLFITATGGNQVLQLANANLDGGSAAMVVRGYGLNGPTGLALDSSGNLYVADTGNNRVMQLGDGFQISVGNGLSAPTGVTTDPSGSVIIADGTGRLIRVPNESNGTNAIGLNQADQQVLSSPLSYPYSIRSDNSGNLYVSDPTAAVVDKLQRTTGAVNFGNWNVNTVSNAQSIVVSNYGTDKVTFGNPLYPAVPAASEFSVTTGTGFSACGAGVFYSGYNCTVQSMFSPTATGASTYPLSFNVTTPNTTAPVINLTGTGVNQAAATIKLIQTAPTTATISYGQQIIISAKVTPTASTPTPTGYVVFTFNGQNQRPVKLDSTGAAAITFNGLNAGQNTLSAYYEGDVNYASLTSAVLPLNIMLATDTGLFTVVGDSAVPLSVQPTSAITFTDVLTPAVVGLFTGTVTFIDTATNQPVLGSAPIRLGSPDSVTGLYTASYTLQGSSSPIPLGTYNVIAVYSGNSNYVPVTSAAIQYIVIKSIYTVTPDTTTVTASASSPATINLTVTDYSNFQGGVSLQCSGLPANAYCVFRPASAQLVPASGPAANSQLKPLTIFPVPVVLQIKVDQALVPIQSSSVLWISAIALGLLAFWQRRKAGGKLGLASLAAVVCISGLTVLSGCGSTSNAFPTPTGNYPVTITATATPIINGNQPACSYQNCNLPPDPITNPSINVVQTLTVNLTVK